MRSVSTRHPALGRSIVRLARKPPPPNTKKLPPVNSAVSSLLSNGAGGGAQLSTSPASPPAYISTAGSGGSGGGGNTPTLTASLPYGGGTLLPSTSFSPTSAPGGLSSAVNASIGSSTASSSGPGVSGNFTAVGGVQSAPVNVGAGSSIATSTALGASTPGALSTDIPSSSQHPLDSGSNVVGTESPSPTTTTTAAVSSGKQLSSVAIAGITIVCLFFLLALTLVVVRRRSIVRRVELRRRWWFDHHSSSGDPSLVDNGSPRSHVVSSREVPASRQSSRSSFATNFDHGLMPSVGSPSRRSLGVVPDLPPVAEVRERNSVLIPTGGAIACRESLNNILKNGSKPSAQYLTISGHDNPEPCTPMYVRPFSPSESFAFPKPPAPLSPTADSFFFLRNQGSASPQSPATPVPLSTPPRALMTDVPPASVTMPSLYPQTSMSSASLSPFVASANPSVNPFADPEIPGFADVEVVRRPFKPSLNDELAVYPGDRVRVLQIFDDGWACIVKLAGTDGERQERGLIPTECLCEAGPALPTLLPQKRASSYVSDRLVAVAL